jgi:hypothetical protein
VRVCYEVSSRLSRPLPAAHDRRAAALVLEILGPAREQERLPTATQLGSPPRGAGAEIVEPRHGVVSHSRRVRCNMMWRGLRPSWRGCGSGSARSQPTPRLRASGRSLTAAADCDCLGVRGAPGHE